MLCFLGSYDTFFEIRVYVFAGCSIIWREVFIGVHLRVELSPSCTIPQFLHHIWLVFEHVGVVCNDSCSSTTLCTFGHCRLVHINQTPCLSILMDPHQLGHALSSISHTFLTLHDSLKFLLLLLE